MYHETTGDRVLSDLDQGVLRITFNRPAHRNALEEGMSAEIAALMRKAQEDPKVRCVLFRGTDPYFSSGGDVSGFKAMLDQQPSERVAAFDARLDQANALAESVIAFDRPVVSAVRGGVAGGSLIFPLASDVVICDPTAMFVFAHLRLGISPETAVTYLLPRIVGVRVANSIVLRSEVIDAERAARLGISDMTVDPANLAAEADKLARALAAGADRATRATKRMMRLSLDRSLETQLADEKTGVLSCLGTADFDEGARAFLEKRRPNFT
ncbi:MAG: enoyl-CoA hydratase/isomerase family protein [Sagittula sp.]|uniref:enoyl-CoA hydratase/isomerase family protein n=1 Tax=Sagittula sp. TaxID=2038081 RepID=UPI004059FDE3